MLDELNTNLPIAAFCFYALSTKASKATLWSKIDCYFVESDVLSASMSADIVAIEMHSEVFTSFNSFYYNIVEVV